MVHCHSDRTCSVWSVRGAIQWDCEFIDIHIDHMQGTEKVLNLCFQERRKILHHQRTSKNNNIFEYCTKLFSNFNDYHLHTEKTVQFQLFDFRFVSTHFQFVKGKNQIRSRDQPFCSCSKPNMNNTVSITIIDSSYKPHKRSGQRRRPWNATWRSNNYRNIMNIIQFYRTSSEIGPVMPDK